MKKILLVLAMGSMLMLPVQAKANVYTKAAAITLGAVIAANAIVDVMENGPVKTVKRMYDNACGTIHWMQIVGKLVVDDFKKRPRKACLDVISAIAPIALFGAGIYYAYKGIKAL